MRTEATSADALGFIHLYEPGAPRAPVLLLLHGTGGDETDLVPLARMVSPQATILSPRGKVSENGMARFFRRLAEGVFDLEDVAFRADELAGFVAAARAAYHLPAPVALGVSNGANVAAAMMLRQAGVLAGAALLRPQPTLVPETPADLTGTPVLIVSGSRDPLVPESESLRLAKVFDTAGAEVRRESLPIGHGLVQADVNLVRDWLADHAMV